MQPLSAEAAAVLDRMKPDRRYDVDDLRAFVTDISQERLREIMHELWVHRQVEREHSGWRRQPSVSPHAAPRTVPRTAVEVKPEDLFDHGTFADFFK